MALFSRRETPPTHVVSRLPRDERVVSWADVHDGGVVLATPRGLWWPDSDEHRLVGWQFVDKVIWRDGTLTVVEAEVVDDLLLVDRPPISAQLTRPRDLPPTVRRRVEANVVQSELRSLPGGAGRFVARRTPGRDGVVWRVRLEPGTPDTEQLRAHAGVILGELRAEWAAEE